MSRRKHSNASMEDGDLASGSDAMKKLKSEASKEIVVDNRIPSQAEKEKKCLRGLAELLIRIGRLSPHSFMQHLGPLFPFGVSQLENEVLKIHTERKEPVMEWSKDFKALEWWKEESQKYPILSRVARDILSIPISRATSWDAYVAGKREPPEFVLSLEPKIANAMMCSRKLLRL